MDSAAARAAGEMLETVLLAPVLRPLIAGAGSGMLGDYELDLLAQEVAHRDGGRLRRADRRRL